MIKLRLSLLIVLSACMVAGLGAQAKAAASPSPAPEKGGSVTIEDLYLSQEVEVQVLRSQVLSNNRETKMLALQSLGSMIDEKRLGPDNKDMIAMLESLAGEGVFKIVRLDGSVSNYFPDVRREAVGLLGKVGGKDSKVILQRVILADKEPMVLAEAVYAMGRMATADDKDVLPYIGKVMLNNNNSATPDNNLAYSCLLTIERLSGTFNGIAEPELISALLDTASSGLYIKDVSAKAKSVIGKLLSTKSTK